MCWGHTGVSNVRTHRPVLYGFPSFLVMISSASVTPEICSISSAVASLNHPFRTTPFEQFKVECGLTLTGSPQNSTHWRRRSESDAVPTLTSNVLPCFWASSILQILWFFNSVAILKTESSLKELQGAVLLICTPGNCSTTKNGENLAWGLQMLDTFSSSSSEPKSLCLLQGRFICWSNKLGIFLLVLGVWESGWVTDSKEAEGRGHWF